MDRKNTDTTNVRTAPSNATRTLELRSRVKEHPYAALAAVAGVGYVLGGGLFTRLTARTVTLALRVGASLAVWPLLEIELGGLAEALEPKPRA